MSDPKHTLVYTASMSRHYKPRLRVIRSSASHIWVPSCPNSRDHTVRYQGVSSAPSITWEMRRASLSLRNWHQRFLEMRWLYTIIGYIPR